LSALVFASKASNGYDSAFMEACRAELTITAEHIARGHYRVARERDDHPIGVAAWRWLGRGIADVNVFFVAPGAQRRGVGGSLWRVIETEVRHSGAERITIEADPAAVPFYESMGAIVVGDAPSGSIPGRRLPLMVKVLMQTEAPE
jgi:GNAT superfamily N-acetyltransferase